MTRGFWLGDYDGDLGDIGRKCQELYRSGQGSSRGNSGDVDVPGKYLGMDSTRDEAGSGR